MSIIEYFENIPSLHRALILGGGIAFFWMLETLIPLFQFKYRKFNHALPNLFLTLTTVIVNLLFAFLIVYTSDYLSGKQIGILYIFSLPLWAFILLGIMILDLIGAWLIHFIEHQVHWMWRFHIVHHTDMHVDTTTANRHHPIESVFRATFTLLAVIVSGAPIYLVMLYQSVSVILSQFNHANISFPPVIDKLISFIIVSPNMHKVHHHFKRPLTDTNYGNIFAIWDRIFGTFASVLSPKKDLVYGIDAHMDEKESQQTLNLLAIPFKKDSRSETNE
jgi:sterol desaturase/sphingolipid hydroxylase (fatty acid hydroxylase superfamily)